LTIVEFELYAHEIDEVRAAQRKAERSARR